jgi:signal transduction histidine kinase
MRLDSVFRWLHLWRRTADPTWVGPVVAGLALFLTILAIRIDHGHFESATDTRLINLALGGYGLVMLAVTGGFRLPLPFFLLLTLTPIAYAAYGGRDTIVPMLAMIVVWWVTYTGDRRAGVLTAACALVSILPPFVTGRGSLDNFFSWSISLVLIWLSVYSVVMLQRTLAALRVAQADLARQAAAEERRRLAREVHDVVAHSLAITLLHVTGARHILQRDPKRAAEALTQAETLGRQSMADLRRTIGLLSAEAESGVAPPAPTARDIPALLDSFAAAGLAVERQLCADFDAIPPGLGLDLYRLTQEALTNVAKHGAGAAQVQLTLHQDVAQIEVTNPFAPSPSSHERTAGRGLRGMGERVAAYGGEFQAGPQAGQWRVLIRLPLNQQKAVSE